MVPITQVAWTGPKVEGSFLRATREVVRELFGEQHMNCWSSATGSPLATTVKASFQEVIDSLGDAVQRRVSVTLVVDERNRDDGRNNRQILLEAWPSGSVTATDTDMAPSDGGPSLEAPC